MSQPRHIVNKRPEFQVPDKVWQFFTTGPNKEEIEQIRHAYAMQFHLNGFPTQQPKDLQTIAFGVIDHLEKVQPEWVNCHRKLLTASYQRYASLIRGIQQAFQNRKETEAAIDRLRGIKQGEKDDTRIPETPGIDQDTIVIDTQGQVGLTSSHPKPAVGQVDSAESRIDEAQRPYNLRGNKRDQSKSVVQTDNEETKEILKQETPGQPPVKVPRTTVGPAQSASASGKKVGRPKKQDDTPKAEVATCQTIVPVSTSLIPDADAPDQDGAKNLFVLKSQFDTLALDHQKLKQRHVKLQAKYHSFLLKIKHEAQLRRLSHSQASELHILELDGAINELAEGQEDVIEQSRSLAARGK